MWFHKASLRIEKRKDFHITSFDTLDGDAVHAVDRDGKSIDQLIVFACRHIFGERYEVILGSSLEESKP